MNIDKPFWVTIAGHAVSDNMGYCVTVLLFSDFIVVGGIYQF